MRKFVLRVLSNLTGGNYADRLKQIQSERGTRLNGLASIRHDDWCAHFRGAACNCEPDIYLFEVSSDSSDAPR